LASLSSFWNSRRLLDSVPGLAGVLVPADEAEPRPLDRGVNDLKPVLDDIDQFGGLSMRPDLGVFGCLLRSGVLRVGLGRVPPGRRPSRSSFVLQHDSQYPGLPVTSRRLLAELIGKIEKLRVSAYQQKIRKTQTYRHSSTRWGAVRFFSNHLTG
jgi:hypothetical protein